MSAEVENSKEEEVKDQKVKKPLKKRILEQWPAGVKVLELLICAICMGLIYEPISHVTHGRILMHHVGVMYTAYTGYMVINCVLLVSRALGDRVPYRTVSLFALMGSALFLITGIVLALDKSKNDFYNPLKHLGIMMTVSILFAFINIIVFAVDAVFTFTRQENF